MDDNTFVFGGKDTDKWFKMRAVDANGKGIENRYTSAISKFSDLSVAVWNSANKGGAYRFSHHCYLWSCLLALTDSILYSVSDVETGTCDADVVVNM